MKIYRNSSCPEYTILIIYEVTLSIEATIYQKFFHWLKLHVKEMLRFPGFLTAEIGMIENPESDYHHLRVQYTLESRSQLEEYFTQHAANMREQGKQLFGEAFTATRRIINLNI